MGVEVIFRGACLFREDARAPKEDRRRLRDILIPDTSSEKARDWPLPRHFARLVVLDATGNVVSRHNLDGTRVEIVDPLNGPCVLQPSCDQLQDVHLALKASAARLKENVQAVRKGTDAQRVMRKGAAAFEAVDCHSAQARTRQDERATARITCVGGALFATQGVSGWRFAGEDALRDVSRSSPRRSPAALVSWRSLSSSAVIHIAPKDEVAPAKRANDVASSATTSVILDANHPRAYVYNYDEEWPSISQLAGYDEGEPDFSQGPIKDKDFGWCYYMLASEALRKNFDELALPQLDEASYNGHGVRNPGSSAGCFPGLVTAPGV